MKKSNLIRVLHKTSMLLIIISVFACILTPLIYNASAITDTSTNLPSDSTQKAQAEAIGFDTEQMPRISPSGKEVVKNLNPLGPNVVSLNRVRQLAIVKDAGSGGSLYAYKNPLGKTALNIANPVTNGIPPLPGAWKGAEKAMTAADIDGNGKQEVVTAGLFLKTDGAAELRIHITDYNSVKTITILGNTATTPNSKEYIAVTLLNYDMSYTEPIVRTVAGDFDRDGKDEVAVMAGRNIYLFKMNMSTLKLSSSVTFDQNSNIAKVKSGTWPKIDIEAQDANGDGYTDLLVAMGYQDTYGTPASRLLIYDKTDLTKPVANINLKPSIKSVSGTYSSAYLSPSVDVGDVFGDGTKTIVVGGKLSFMEAVFLQYIRFNPVTERYDSEQTINSRGYFLFKDIPKHGIESAYMGIKCASLDGPVPGAPEYLVIGGYIFKYEKGEDVFKKKDVYSATNNSGQRSNDAEKSQGSITNINVEKDKTYIMDILVGNFDGNASGKEQIIMLHSNQWYGDKYLYVSWSGMDESRRINAFLTQQHKGTSAIHPAICAPDLYNNCTRLVFKPEKSKFVFSNPIVIAVLGASPYYNELIYENVGYENSLGAVSTVYGTGTEEAEEKSNAFSLEVNSTFGVKQEGSFILKITEVSFEAEINNSFSYTYAESKSITRSVSYANGYDNDAVVVAVVPSDLYYYDVYSPDGTSTEMVLNIPYSPMTIMKEISDYNAASAKIDNAPMITSDVLKHTVGDPRTYPQSSAALSNIKGKEVLLGVTDENTLVATGTGYNWVEQSIETSEGSSKAYDYELSIGIKYNVNILGATVGGGVAAGYKHNLTVSSTKTTTRTGSVAGIPKGYDRYSFSWCLAAYNYNLIAGDETQECTVINYLVKPVGSFPPRPPANVRTEATSRTLDSVRLLWDSVDGALGYRLYRSTSPTDSNAIDKIIDVGNETSFTDSGMKPEQNYYYRVVAYAAKNSVASEVLANEALALYNMQVITQPKISYDSGDALDLSGLSLALTFDDGSALIKKNIPYSDMSGDFSVSFDNGAVLDASDTGIPITILYTPYNRSVKTNNLSVKAIEPYDVTLNVSFTVGNAKNATTLVPNQPLVANITLKNNAKTPQQVLVIFALYNNTGTMEKMTYATTSIGENLTVTMNQSLVLPSIVNGYIAKVFVWDGFNFITTTQTPKSATVQIPQ